MADEENKDQIEETPEGDASEQQPEADAPEEQPEAEAPAESEEASKEAEPPPAAEAADASADETAGDEGGPSQGADEALEGLDWKARRRLERSRRPAEAHPQRTPEDKAAGRAERRAQTRKVRASHRRKRREKAEGGTGTPPAERRSVARKVRQGTVVSDRADKTITVRIDVARRHSVYEKIVRSSNTLHAHDERNEANEGDLVRIVETRPISRHKRWRLVEVLEKAK